MTPDASFPGSPRRVLLIDDSATCRHLIRHHLLAENFEVLEAADGRAGLELARSRQAELILLGLRLPDGDGFELIRRLKEDPRTRSIPVVFVSSSASPRERARGLDLGASDFLSKPVEPVEFCARVRAVLRTKDLQDLLEQRAHLDGLTGLANRHALEERIEAEWAACRRRGCSLAVVIADLDHFKRINDRHGHAAGDLVLRAAASALRTSVRSSDFVARFGGEEFVALAPDCDLAGAVAMAERYRAAVAGLDLGFHRARIRATTSVGVASTSSFIGAEPAEILARADQALYQAKASGRDAVWAWNRDEIDEKSASGFFLAVNAGTRVLDSGSDSGLWVFNPELG